MSCKGASGGGQSRCCQTADRSRRCPAKELREAEDDNAEAVLAALHTNVSEAKAKRTADAKEPRIQPAYCVQRHPEGQGKRSVGQKGFSSSNSHPATTCRSLPTGDGNTTAISDVCKAGAAYKRQLTTVGTNSAQSRELASSAQLSLHHCTRLLERCL